MGTPISFWQKLRRKSTIDTPTTDLPLTPTTASDTSATPPPSPQPLPQKTLADLEAELFPTTPQPQPQRRLSTSKPAGQRQLKQRFNQILGASLFLAVPVGMVYLANLPYPMIRRPIANSVPILLLPSYLKIESNFKQAQATVEEARQLIEAPTSPSDLDRGAEKLRAGKQYLNAIPLWFANDWADYSYSYTSSYRWWRWYDWRFTPAGLQATRVKTGELEARLFQEQNAQKTLAEAEQTLAQVKTTYQTATKPADKQAAIQQWQGAIDQLSLVPATTLAGRTAKQKLAFAQRDFAQTVGSAAGGQIVVSELDAAKNFARQAISVSQKPPYSVVEWQQSVELWQEAINRLEKVSSQDLAAYQEAQALLAEYKRKLGDIQIRLENERIAVAALDDANEMITNLIANQPANPQAANRNRLIGEIQTIINKLDKIPAGTTVFAKAQELKQFAQEKLNQLQP